MLCSTTIQTRLGNVELIADEQSLIEIVLPGNTRKTGIDPQKSSDHHEIFAKAAQQIQEFLEGKRTKFTLPLSTRGTPFQMQVWEIIHSIPYAQTMSYGAIGARLGNSNKARAVGGAAHVNPLPLVIPCHRVIGSTGSLTGFAGGLSMKEHLLTMEGIRLG